MAQAQIDRRKIMKDVSVQTGSENIDILYYLPNKKSIRIYHSNVYKERVISFNISSSKGFIMNKDNWKQFVKILPQLHNSMKN